MIDNRIITGRLLYFGNIGVSSDGCGTLGWYVSDLLVPGQLHLDCVLLQDWVSSFIVDIVICKDSSISVFIQTFFFHGIGCCLCFLSHAEADILIPGIKGAYIVCGGFDLRGVKNRYLLSVISRYCTIISPGLQLFNIFLIIFCPFKEIKIHFLKWPFDLQVRLHHLAIACHYLCIFPGRREHDLSMIAPELVKLRIGPMIHHQRFPIFIHNLAGVLGIVLPVPKPFFECLCPDLQPLSFIQIGLLAIRRLHKGSIGNGLLFDLVKLCVCGKGLFFSSTVQHNVAGVLVHFFLNCIKQVLKSRVYCIRFILCGIWVIVLVQSTLGPFPDLLEIG